MDLQTLTNKIQKYIHVRGAESKDLIKGFINDSILDFVKLAQWNRLNNVESIVLDGSGSYPLAAFTSGQFWGEIELINAGSGDNYYKIDYNMYLRAPNKNKYFSIFGNNIYVEGDNLTLSLLYKDIGLQYPLTNPTDEVPATLYYYDIIEKMAVIYFLDYAGDDEAKVAESNKLSLKVAATRKDENRTNKNGQLKMVRRNWQGAV
jgi:hypothetical protein